MKKLLLFDIDGTLLRVENATLKAINETFERLFKTDGSLDELYHIAWTDLGLFREAAVKRIGRPFSSTEYEAFVKLYIERLQVQLDSCKFYLMPGIEELLPRLAERENLLLGIETGNIVDSAFLKLQKGGIDGYFATGGFGSDSDDRAELILAAIERARILDGNTIPVDNIYVIDDAPYGIKAAKKVGVHTIAVGTGIAPQEQVLAEKPDHYLKDLTYIPAFLRCIGENDERN